MTNFFPKNQTVGTTIEETAHYTLATAVTTSTAVPLAGVRFYCPSTNFSGSYTAVLYEVGTSYVLRQTVVTPVAGWNEVLFQTPYTAVSGKTYIAGFYAPGPLVSYTATNAVAAETSTYGLSLAQIGLFNDKGVNVNLEGIPVHIGGSQDAGLFNATSNWYGVEVIVGTISVTATASPSTVPSGQQVTLTAATLGGDGAAISYAWTQTAGSAVTLSSSSVASPTFTPITAGSYTFQVTVTQSGNTATSSVSLTVLPPDTTAPSAPTGLTIAGKYATYLTLSWSAATDDRAVTGYEVFANGVSKGTTAELSLQLTGLTAGTTYALTVKARDAAGNWSAASTAVNTTTLAANAGPTLTATATDSLGSATVVTKQAPYATSPSGPPTTQKWLHRWRTQFASLSPGPLTAQGPLIVDTIVTGMERGIRFRVTAENCTLNKVRILKPPTQAGSNIPVTLWDVEAHTEITSTTMNWTVNQHTDGGWAEVALGPVALEKNKLYAVSYYCPPGEAYRTEWRFNAQEYREYPFSVGGNVLLDSTGFAWRPGAFLFDGTAHGYPVGNVEGGLEGPYSNSWMWIDVGVTMPVDRPLCNNRVTWFDQFSNGHVDKFLFAVFAIDTDYYDAYKAMGINFMLPYSYSDRDRDQLKQAGVPFGMLDYETVADPGLSALCRGGILWDEPDIVKDGQKTPDQLRDQVFLPYRRADSSRWIALGFGNQMLEGQAYTWYPVGANPETTERYWRQYAQLADVIYGDDYAIRGTANPGIWRYGNYVERLRGLSDGTKPVMVCIETCYQNGDRGPTATEMIAAAWQVILHGAVGIIWFDHQFYTGLPDGTVIEQDFQFMLHHDAIKTPITAFHALIDSVSPALLAPEANLITAWDSSNKTAGPIGGKYGVPIEYRTAIASGQSYVFAQASRPGTTTATFTVPSAANKTITVLNESRSVTADANGVFTDTFSADYVTHIYRWS